ncbi:hypothetical protein [Pseudoxanthomonas suwonensis]|uniref:hypothetical protein n=1 Tax=Pseudoxanthomonas suwonensis TaxID=314722 RepID=UPI0004651AD8|nr:hypothetical protein [Pseudoxanthomonas suwonensis]
MRLTFKLPNIYLKAGVAMLLLALACAVALWAIAPAEPLRMWLSWCVRAGFLGGVVLFVTGRVVQGVRAATRYRTGG